MHRKLDVMRLAAHIRERHVSLGYQQFTIKEFLSRHSSSGRWGNNADRSEPNWLTEELSCSAACNP